MSAGLCSPRALVLIRLAASAQNDNRDDEFLISRILFLTTYNTNLDFERLIDQYHLADNINTVTF